LVERRIRLVLADDHPVVLYGLRGLFAAEADIDIVGSCADGDAALEAVRTHHPDVLVLDLRMGLRSGLDVVRILAAEGHACRIVLLTAAVRDVEVIEAVRLGAAGLVIKESPPEVLIDCVRRVHRGEQWIDRETVARAFGTAVGRSDAGQRQEEALTPRETEIVQMVALGLRNRAIAQRLSISEGTVKVHLHNIYEKLGVDGRFELITSANWRGLL
jgi:DNA-binding NarL/FixJ family response regulator